ncbi:MAG: GTPase HflX [Spirochaetaceae bacterium]|nr:MAG: GTPase HflX [Spirochaetaceae bacterium]
MIEHKKTTNDKAFLIGVHRPGSAREDARTSLDELSGLVSAVRMSEVGRAVLTIKTEHPRYLVGSGRALEMATEAKEAGADFIVFDEELSPSQQRNWDKVSGITTIDRHEIIIDIFARRARSHEAIAQVELARMEYSLPRLTNQWTHLSRQRGGARGTRGEGETQLELDRRQVLRRIARVKRDLEKLAERRETLRRRRTRVPLTTAAVVGYTNAGKSSFIERLTGADIFVANQLFATLDPTTKILELPDLPSILLTDTVGFVRKLPHGLIEAFKSTLEEAVQAQFLIHVVDASNPDMLHQFEVTRRVLAELGAQQPTIVVLNKRDLVAELPVIPATFGEAIPFSCTTGYGLDEVLDRIQQIVRTLFESETYHFPATRHDLAALVHRNGEVMEESFTDDEIRIHARLDEQTRARLEKYRAPRVS